MHKWLKISHHEHSGRLRPHENTSYLPLALLMLVVGVALTVCSAGALSSPGPEANSIGLTGSMPGPAPKVAATITTPRNGQHFTETPVTISGTCPEHTLVELYKNDIFAGSGTCTGNGSFSFDIDLLIGENTLIARVYNALNQPGPDSNPVVVYYDAMPFQASPLASLNFGGSQLLLNTNSVYRGIFPGHDLSIPINILGGVAPYAVNVQWGDSHNNVVSRNDNTPFNTSHAYDKPGTYQITIQATDSQGRVAFLTVAAIVNGQPTVALANTVAKPPVNKLLVLWPLYAIAITIVVSFWLGERREKKILMASPAFKLHPQV